MQCPFCLFMVKVQQLTGRPMGTLPTFHIRGTQALQRDLNLWISSEQLSCKNESDAL